MAPPFLKTNLKVACPSQPPGGRNGTHSLRNWHSWQQTDCHKHQGKHYLTKQSSFCLNFNMSQVWILNFLEDFEGKKIHTSEGTLTIWSCLNSSLNEVCSKYWLFNGEVRYQIKWHHKRQHGIIDGARSYENHLCKDRNFGKGMQNSSMDWDLQQQGAFWSDWETSYFLPLPFNVENPKVHMFKNTSKVNV